MKPITLFLVIALVPAGIGAAHAKTLNTAESGTDQKSVSGVAGPAVAAQNSGPSQNGNRPSTRQHGKKALKKVKITPPPAMHDPN